MRDTETINTDPINTEKPTSRAVAMTVALAALVLANAILETMPGLALPVIQPALGITPAAGGLLIAALTLTAAISTPIIGKLGDAFGPRRILFGTTAIVIVGAVLSGIGASYPLMIVGEALQGLGAGLLSLTFTLVRSELPERWVKGVVGAVTAMYVLGATINLLMVGPVSTLLSWHWLFGLPAVLAAVAAVAAWWLVPSRPRAKDHVLAIGWPGALSFAVFLVALIMAIETIPQTGLASVGTLVMAAVVVALGIGWFLLERRSRTPFVPLAMIARRGIWTSNAAALVQGIGSVVGTILLPQLITLPRASGGLGGSITEVGLYLLPSCIAGVIGTPLGGIAGQWVGARTVIAVGSVFQLVGVAGLVMAPSLGTVLLLTVIFGFGMGAASAGMYNLGISASGSHETGLATGLINLARAIGIALGSVITTTIITASIVPGTQLPTGAGFVLAFTFSGAALVIGVVLAFVMPAQPEATVPKLVVHQPA
jgi:MFS family permease